MPRARRLLLDQLPLHIVQRGHNRAPCFFSDVDRQLYLTWLRSALCEYECHLHAYVIMTNHVHLLVTPRRAERVAKLMMSIGSRFVQYINRTQVRSGTLWESRYRASVVDRDAYLLACYRYIELNPVRAGMVRGPGEYCWSSYRANALGCDDPFVVPHPVYLALGCDGSERCRAYQGLFTNEQSAQIVAEIRHSLNRSQPLGNADFVAEVERRTGVPRTRPGRGRPRFDKEKSA